MTIAQVTQGIVDALYSGIAGITIYTETVDQNLQTPAVLVKCLNPSQNVSLGRRYRKQLQYAVQYFPEDESGNNDECNAACDSMFLALENITVSGRVLHGTDMQGAVTNGVLTFNVNYSAFILKEQAEADMETVEVDVELVEGERK